VDTSELSSKGDTVTRHKNTGNKTIDKLSALQEGPYTITQVEDTGVDYTIKRKGSTEPPVRVHVDEIKAFETFSPAVYDEDSDYGSEDDELQPAAAQPQPAATKPAKKHSKRHEVQRIMAERRLSPRQGGQVQYLIQWKDSDGKSFPCSWEPAENLECPVAIQTWSVQDHSGRTLLLKRARKIGINAVSKEIPVIKQLSDTETLLLWDLAYSRRGRMVLDVCKKLNIDPAEVLFVWASPPCDTYSKLGPVNAGRGTHTRNYKDPAWPPRHDGSSQSKKAEQADDMTENLTHSLMKARELYNIHYAVENPAGGMSRRPFMQNPDWLQHTQCLIVDYCAFNHPVKKPTNIWISEMTWTPTGETGDGRCNQACSSGSIDPVTHKHRHNTVLAGRGDRALKPPHIDRQKNSVPALLQQELLKAAMLAADGNRKIVIDLFAGYGSMRKVTEEFGLQYVGVDIKDFMR